MKNLLYLAAIVFTISAHAQTTYPIAWTNPINVSVNGDNSLTKTSAAGAWDATIASKNTLLAGQDGFLQFTFQPGTSIFMVGLSKFNNDPDQNATDYNIYINANSFRVYYNGTNFGPFTAAAGNVLKISREGTLMKFYNNTTLVHSVTSGNTNNYRADISIHTGSAPVVTASFIPALMVKAQVQAPTLANNDGQISLQVEGQSDPVTYSWAPGGETTSTITGKARGTYTVTVTDALSRVVTRTYYLGYPVAWTNLANVTVDANNALTKTDADGWGTAGGSAFNVLPPNTDGYVEFVVNEPGANYMIGLSRIDNGLNYTTIGYAWQIGSTGLTNIQESGAAQGVNISYMKGDVFRIERQSTSIKYYHNGVLKRTATIAYLNQFVVDVAVNSKLGPMPTILASFDKQIRVIPAVTLPDNNNANGSIALSIQGTYPPTQITWTGQTETSNILSGKSRGTYPVTITDNAAHTFSTTYRLGYPVEWTDLQNTAVNANNVLYKSIGDGNGLWDGSGVSANVLAPSTPGWIQFVLPQAVASTFAIGLSRLNTVPSYTGIDYCFYFNNGSISIQESGVNRGTVASQREGMVFTIERDATSIRYYINGIEVRNVATNTSYQLVVDQSIMDGSTSMVTASFSRSGQTFYSIANGSWNNPAVWSLSEGGTAATLFPTKSDNVVIKGFGVTVDSGISAGVVNVIVTNENTFLKVDGVKGELKATGNVVVKGENNTATTKALIVQNEARLSVQ
jgi:hypothetical protein